jgi:hypothetical protein
VKVDISGQEMTAAVTEEAVEGPRDRRRRRRVVLVTSTEVMLGVPG